MQAVSLEDTMQNEMMSYLTDKGRREALENLHKTMQNIVTDILHLQSYLINLEKAFALHPLPQGWELRINTETAMPYWVDHVNKTTSVEPPPSPPPPSSLPPSLPPTKSPHPVYTLKTLPEFNIFAHR